MDLLVSNNGGCVLELRMSADIGVFLSSSLGKQRNAEI